jgi:hypothetical protein
MFYGLVIMSLKSIVCILLKSYLSFMFDDFDIVNLVPKHILLRNIKLNIKNGNKLCFEN